MAAARHQRALIDVDAVFAFVILMLRAIAGDDIENRGVGERSLRRAAGPLLALGQHVHIAPGQDLGVVAKRDGVGVDRFGPGFGHRSGKDNRVDLPIGHRGEHVGNPRRIQPGPQPDQPSLQRGAIKLDAVAGFVDRLGVGIAEPEHTGQGRGGAADDAIALGGDHHVAAVVEDLGPVAGGDGGHRLVADARKTAHRSDGSGRIEGASVGGIDIAVGVDQQRAGCGSVAGGADDGGGVDGNAGAEAAVVVADGGSGHAAFSAELASHHHLDVADRRDPTVACYREVVLLKPVAGAEIDRRRRDLAVAAHHNLRLAVDGVIDLGASACIAKRGGDAFAAAVDPAVVAVLARLIHLAGDRQALAGLDGGSTAHSRLHRLVAGAVRHSAGASDRETTKSQRRTHRVGKDRVLAGGNEIDPLGRGCHEIADAGLQFRVAIGSAKGAVGLEVAKTSCHTC